MTRRTQRTIQTLASVILLGGAGYFAYVELWPWIKTKLDATGGAAGAAKSATGRSEAAPQREETLVIDDAVELAQTFAEKLRAAIGMGTSPEGIIALAETGWPYSNRDLEEKFLTAYELGLVPIPSGQGDYTKSTGAAQFTM